MTSNNNTDGFSVAMWTTTQQTWHPKAGRSTYMCVHNRKGTVGDSWQPDGRHSLPDRRLKACPHWQQIVAENGNKVVSLW